MHKYKMKVYTFKNNLVELNLILEEIIIAIIYIALVNSVFKLVMIKITEDKLKYSNKFALRIEALLEFMHNIVKIH